MATARPNMGVGSSSSEHHTGDSSMAAEFSDMSVGDPTPLSPTGGLSFSSPNDPLAAAIAGPSGGDQAAISTPDGNGEQAADSAESASAPEYELGHGHYFTKKTFHKPTYCHHCTDMLWGLIGQGFICEGKSSLALTASCTQTPASATLTTTTTILTTTTTTPPPTQQQQQQQQQRNSQALNPAFVAGDDRIGRKTPRTLVRGVLEHQACCLWMCCVCCARW
jgi:hypothetical protein